MKICVNKNLDNLNSDAVTVVSHIDSDKSQIHAAVPHRAVILPHADKNGKLSVQCRISDVIAEHHTLRAEEKPTLFDVDSVACSVVVGNDAFRPEVFRWLALMGAKVVFCVQHFDETTHCEEDILFGAWSNAQANNLFVVAVSNISTSVICPCSLSEDDSGFLARGRTDDFTIDLPVERFFEGQRSFPVFQSLNKELYSRYFSGENINSSFSPEAPLRSRKAARILAKRKLSPIEPSDTERRTVCAVQYKLRPMRNAKEYLCDLEKKYRTAAENGAKLIVFPELFGITPLCTKPFLRSLFREKSSPAQPFSADPSPVSLDGLRVFPSENGLLPKAVKALVKLMKSDTEMLMHALSHLSKKYSIITATGSFLELSGDKLYNTQYLIDENGTLIGKQRKINPMESELSLGINYAESIDVFETSIGRIAIPVCMDASYFENFCIMHAMGAEIIALGTFNLEEYNRYLALRGIVPRCSEYPLLAVKSAMTGYAAGNIATGYAEIAAPCSMAQGGLLAKSSSFLGDELVFAQLPEECTLSEARDSFGRDPAGSLLSDIYT